MSSSAAVERLTAARDMVARGWCQGTGARMADGRAAMIWDQASCFCAMGALGMALHIEARRDGREPTWPETERLYLRRAMGADVVTFNDAPGRRQAEVVAAFNRAIALAANDADVADLAAAHATDDAGQVR